MSTYFVTGATGLIGSKLCGALLARGDRVRALVRDTSAAELDPGVELLEGDIADPEAVARGAGGADAIVHCAAILGGVAGRFEPSDYERINLKGTINVLDAADQAPVVVLSTIAALQTETVPVTENTPIPAEIENENESPYTRTKRLALIEIERRVRSGELDVRVVVPGGIYGPAPALRRALAPTSFNSSVRQAVKGEISRYARVPLGWSFAADVTGVVLASLERGRAGGRYLAITPAEDAITIAGFLTRACRIAGVDHEVEDVPPSEDPAYEEEFAGMARIARRAFPAPLFENRMTVEELGFEPTAIDEGLAKTVEWLRENGEI